jgi:hypothetical protein
LFSLTVIALISAASTAAIRMMAKNGGDAEKAAQDRATLSIVLNRMRQELTSALTVTELTSGSITFATPDISGSASNTVRYTRSGSQLTRQVNGAAAVVLLDTCDDFKLLADVEGTLSPPANADSAELLLVEHQTYLLPPITTSELSLTATSLVAQTFTPGDVTAQSFKVSRARLMVRRTTTTSGNLVLEIRPTRSGTDDPASTVIDRTLLALSSLSTTAAWVDVPFATASALTIGTEYALVMSSDISFTYTRVTADTASLSQVADGTLYRRSTDGGSTWTPVPVTAALTDARFQLYGRYQTTDQSGTRTVQSGRLKSLLVHIAATFSGKSAALDGGAVCLNQPNLAGFVANNLPLIKPLP